MTRLRSLLLFALLPLALAGWTTFHLEVTASHPAEDASIAAAPDTVWIQFNVPPDLERSSFSVRGPQGAVALGTIEVGDQPEVLRAAVEGAMPSGTYTVSWVGAPMDDHTVRGQYEFTVAAQR